MVSSSDPFPLLLHGPCLWCGFLSSVRSGGMRHPLVFLGIGCSLVLAGSCVVPFHHRKGPPLVLGDFGVPGKKCLNLALLDVYLRYGCRKSVTVTKELPAP